MNDIIERLGMRTQVFAEVRPGIPGPWNDEPDKAQWIDPATELDCLIVRGHSGALCGYVGCPPGHPWYEVGFWEVGDVRVHGGLTFSDFCQDGAGEELAVCHVPAPGRPDRVWWLGFDCAHAGDFMPTFVADLMRAGPRYTASRAMRSLVDGVYRDFGYVVTRVTELAEQVAAAGRS